MEKQDYTSDNQEGDQDMSLSEAFQELEKITQKVEQEEVDLEESLGYLEHGLTLARTCKKRLQQVENRVKEIQEEFNQDPI